MAKILVPPAHYTFRPYCSRVFCEDDVAVYCLFAAGPMVSCLREHGHAVYWDTGFGSLINGILVGSLCLYNVGLIFFPVTLLIALFAKLWSGINSAAQVNSPMIGLAALFASLLLYSSMLLAHSWYR